MADCYKMIQLTNKNIQAVAAASLIPLGIITRRVSPNRDNCTTFDVVSTADDTVTINRCGYYRVIYNITAVASAAGVITFNLLVGGTSVYSASVTAADGASVNVTIPYMLRAFANCESLPANLPLTIQIENAGVALTSATADLLIEKTY